jgi:microcystin-dependent protein
MSDQYVGEIRLFAGDYAPQYWAFCDGSLLSIAGNEALYSLIGITYGGDGVNQFALPDLRGRVPIGQGNLLTASGSVAFTVGQKGGNESVTLTTDNMPVHSHMASVQSGSGTSPNPTGNYWAAPGITQYVTSPDTATIRTMNAASVTNTGNNAPHENRMSSIAMNYIIAVFGIYPTQS